MTLCARCMIDGSAALLRALEQTTPPLAAQRPTVRGIVAHAAALFGIPASEITGPGRKRCIARPRQIVAWVAREASGRIWPEIGRILGGRDHSTMIHSSERVEAFAARDPEFAWMVERLWAAGECEPWGPKGGEAALLAPVASEPDAAPPSLWRRHARIEPGEYVPRHALPLTAALFEAAA